MTKSVFKLKQFQIAHGNSSMKVGTDAMILGSMAKHPNPINILDVGTGSGILALMMAQRYPNAIIQGIDLHKNSIEEAKENVYHSPFQNISIQENSFQKFSEQSNIKFDLIVSNPPFFKDDLKSENDSRNSARHNDQLSFEELIQSAKNILSQNGLFWFILPNRYHNEIKELIDENGLFLDELISLTNDDFAVPVRYIYSVSLTKQEYAEQSMNIRINGKYSPEYIELTKDFHDREL